MNRFLSVYNDLYAKYGSQNWWPMSRKFKPPQLEMCIGAILTQNANWKNVEKALDNLIEAKKLTAESIASCPLPALEKLLKPSGFYRQKAKRLKEFCRFIVNFSSNFYKDVTREQLLALDGIGRETADSILLYACNKPYFVIDAYTRRMFSRLGLINGAEDYDEIRGIFEAKLQKNAELYREFHALIVKNEKMSKDADHSQPQFTAPRA